MIHIKYEPNTPLAFRRRDAFHLKQQAGHGKIVVEFGHAQKILSLVLPTMTTYILLIAQQKNRSGV